MGIAILIIYLVCTTDCSMEGDDTDECWGWFGLVKYSCEKHIQDACRSNSYPYLIIFGILVGLTFMGSGVLSILSRKMPGLRLLV